MESFIKLGRRPWQIFGTALGTDPFVSGGMRFRQGSGRHGSGHVSRPCG